MPGTRWRIVWSMVLCLLPWSLAGGPAVRGSDLVAYTAWGDPDLQGTYTAAAGEWVTCPESATPFVVPPFLEGVTTIVQRAGHVVIRNQQTIRDVPVARTAGGPAPAHRYFGRQRGSWDGPTLVIESSELPLPMLRAFADPAAGLDPAARIVERLVAAGPSGLRYEFTFEDAATYARPFVVQLELVRVTTPPAPAAGCDPPVADEASSP